MDTLDKAAGLADWQVADAVNKEWLVSSAELRLRRELDSSRSLENQSIRRASSRSYGTNKLATASYHSINGHLYDNINYAIESCNDDKHQAAQRDNCSSGKFRLWLAAFVLLGITLANYSRNALSLAALGMLAKNAINRELVDLISSSGDSLRNSSLALDEGSCPLAGLVQQDHRLAAATPTSSNQHAHLLQASVKQRVESGDLIDWTLGEQGLISAAGSVGNLLIAIPLTRLGEIHGPKWIIFAALSGATLQAALMPPIAAHCGVWLVMLFQLVFNGLTYGADCVAYTLFAHWLAPTELAFFVSCLIICYQVGAMLSSLITTKILSAGLAWSWCFYAPAILCGIWTLIWALIGASEPALSRLISTGELEYLAKNSKIAQSTRSQLDGKQLAAGARPVSWCKLARDPNIWAIISVKFTLRWYFSAHSALMPTYLATIGHLSVDTIGTMSLVQSLIGLFAGLLMGYLTKSLINSRLFSLSLATTRKCFQSIVNFGLALSLLVFIVYDCNQWVTIVSLTVGVFCLSFLVAAAVQLPLDLSPTHCGLITSITNTLALGQALGAPISGSILTGASRDRWRWRCVWAVASGLNLISGLLFITLVDSKARDYTQDARGRAETRA